MEVRLGRSCIVIFRKVVRFTGIKTAVNTSRHYCRNGVTLVELAVVVAILLLLLAVILPAVQRARSVAVRTACTNNIRQVAIAVQNYDADFRQGPICRSMLFGLSPYLDSGLPELDEVSYWYGVEGIETPKVWQCPAEYELASVGAFSYLPNEGLGADWAFVTDDESLAPRNTVVTHRRNGSDTLHWVRSPRDYADGASNTVSFSERVVVATNRLAQRSVPFRTGSFELIYYTDETVYEPNTFRSKCNDSLTGYEPLFEGVARSWLINRGSSYGFSTIVGPNQTSCFNGPPGDRVVPTGYVAELGAYAANSFHPGGVVGSRADGSCQFYSESIDHNIWVALGTSGGRDAIE